MILEDLLNRVKYLYLIASEEPERFRYVSQELQRDMELQGEEAVSAIVALLDEHDANIVFSAFLVLGAEWAIPNYEKLIEVSRRYKNTDDYMILHHSFMACIMAAIRLYNSAVAKAYCMEFAEWSEIHARHLERWKVEFRISNRDLDLLNNEPRERRHFH